MHWKESVGPLRNPNDKGIWHSFIAFFQGHLLGAHKNIGGGGRPERGAPVGRLRVCGRGVATTVPGHKAFLLGLFLHTEEKF